MTSDQHAAAALETRRAAVVDAAERMVRASGRTKYYEDAFLHQRLDRLAGELIGSIRSHNITSLLEYTSEIAHDRFASGYTLAEIQVVFTRLEEAIWMELCRDLPSDEHAPALALATAALSSAKDALAREYVGLASEVHTPALDLLALVR